jgi:hypothetical protein
MKKFWVLLSLLICSILLTWCYNNDEENLEEFEYSRSCGIYNNKYPARHNNNDWTELTVAVHSWTTFEYIKNIIWKEYICFGWKNSLKKYMKELPNDAIGYKFSLKIYNNDWNKATEIKEKLKNDKNVYGVRIQEMWFN